jgi:hypothetical protein
MDSSRRPRQSSSTTFNETSDALVCRCNSSRARRSVGTPERQRENEMPLGRHRKKRLKNCSPISSTIGDRSRPPIGGSTRRIGASTGSVRPRTVVHSRLRRFTGSQDMMTATRMTNEYKSMSVAIRRMRKLKSSQAYRRSVIRCASRRDAGPCRPRGPRGILLSLSTTPKRDIICGCDPRRRKPTRLAAAEASGFLKKDLDGRCVVGFPPRDELWQPSNRAGSLRRFTCEIAELRQQSWRDAWASR